MKISPWCALVIVGQFCVSCIAQDLSDLIVVEGSVLRETYNHGGVLEDASVCFDVQETILGLVPSNRITVTFAETTTDFSVLSQAKTLILVKEQDVTVQALTWKACMFRALRDDVSVGFVNESFKGQEEKLRRYLKSIEREPLPKKNAIEMAVREARERFGMKSPEVDSSLRNDSKCGWDIAIGDKESSFFENSIWVFIGDDGKYKGRIGKRQSASTRQSDNSPDAIK